MPIWPFRRAVQFAVLISLIAIPVVARYNHYLQTRQLDRFMTQWKGESQANALSVTDRVMRAGLAEGESGVRARRPRTAVLQRTRHVLGSPWSMKLFGLTMTDLVAGLECAVTSHAVGWALAAGLFLPFILTLVLGRVYCGWICPMRPLFDLAARARKLLAYLEVPPGRVTFSPANKYVLVVIGLTVGVVLGVPLLHYLYPPAVMGREAHAWVMSQFDRAENARFGLALAGLSGASLFLLLLLVLEVVAAPGFWCKSLCPGGAVYSVAGRYRLLRVTRDASTCTACADCDRVCPMGLLPMIDRTGQECDNCGLCIDSCAPRSLSYKIAPLALALALVWPAPVAAHHILGIPHYAYDESYPQAPVLRLRERVGVWEVTLTCYPGTPKPGERSEIHVYVTQAQRHRPPWGRPIGMTVFQLDMFGGKNAIYGPASADAQQSLYKFFPRYPAVGQYEVLLELRSPEGIDTLRFPMVVGEPGSPWLTLAAFVCSLAFFIVVVRAIKIKRARRRNGGLA